MSGNGHQTPTQIRASLSHPVIDGDGHWVEFDPVFSERMRRVGGDKAANGWLAALQTTEDALSMSLSERRRRRVAQPGFWTRQASNTLDRATAMMPRLLYERLDEFGCDYAIVYPTAGLRMPRIGDDATRRAVIRAHNFHSSGSNQGLRNSPSNFVYNHIGHFAAAGHAVSKAIFLGGVTRRFPKLRFAFLEGGVGWAAQLFGDLIEHWERRNRKALEKMDPRTLDRGMLMSLAEKYGDPDVAAALQARDGWPDKDANLTGGVEDLDDFSACKITRKEDWVDLYAKPFYFGCEADDRMNGTAFSKNNPFGAKLNALYSSDIGHFDVIDMRDPLPEAYELVEDGVISEDNFRDFTFANAVHLWGTQNPRFFEGTAVAKEAAAELARAAAR